MGTGFVPNRNRIHRARVARAQQPCSFRGIEIEKRGYPVFIKRESRGSFRNAIAEADAQCAIDPHAQISDGALFELAHIPSSPSSARAVSMIAGVISVMPRSLA